MLSQFEIGLDLHYESKAHTESSSVILNQKEYCRRFKYNVKLK